jgi:hypothetical protein
MALQPFVALLPLFSFFIPYTVDRISWTGDQPVARPLLIHSTIQTQNKRTHTSMPRLGFEPTTIVFERAKRVHALNLVATVIKKWNNVDWIYLTPDRDKWRSLADKMLCKILGKS